MKVIDLSYLINEDMMVYPGTEKPSITPRYTIEADGFRESEISIFSHVGTHIDPPAHMLEEGKYLDEFEVTQFIGKAILLDFTENCCGIIQLKDIIKYEEKLKTIDFLIFNTGWSRYWGDNQYFKGYPTLDKEAVQWLSKLNLKGIGVDAISVDKMESEDFYVHKTLFKAGFILIENLTNLNKIEGEIFILSVLPIKYKEADGCPVRAIAII